MQKTHWRLAINWSEIALELALILAIVINIKVAKTDTCFLAFFKALISISIILFCDSCSIQSSLDLFWSFCSF